MKLKLSLTIVALAILGGSFGQTARATEVNVIGKPVAKMTLKEKEQYYRANIVHAKYTLQWFHSTKGSWTLDAKRYPAAYSVASRVVKFNKRLLKYATQKLNRIVAKLRPVVHIVQYSGGHYAGWSCITNGAYKGAPHEGNGYNGSYSGPLGMTTPWEGHYPPGSDWVHSSVSAVYAIAESVASAHHFSYSWMQGQWPETFPPCAGYFR